MSILGDGIVLGAGGESASIFVTGLSETDTVTASKDGKMIIGKWTQKSNPAFVLPTGYTQLEYIESTGTQYINTLYSPAIGDNIKATFMATNSGEKWLLCGAHSNTDLGHGPLLLASDGVFKYCTINVSTNWVTTNIPWTTNTIYNYEGIYNSGNQQININGLTYSSSFSGSISGLGGIYYQLFAFYRGNVGTTGNLRLYNLSIANGNTIYRKFIPCKRNSDNAIGMYDLVTNDFFGNSGTGVFATGAEVPQILSGFLINKIKEYGTWAVSNGNGTKTANVLIDAATEFGVTL